MPFANLTDVHCYYELNGEGEPLLLVPGLGSTCRVWDPVANQLAMNFSLIAVDNRGIGKSIARCLPQTVRDFSADLVELLDHLQVPRAHVMGLSLGGVIAQRFAMDHPDQVSRLVLMSSAHRFGPYLREMAKFVGQARRWFPTPMFARTMEVLCTGPTYLDANPHRVVERLREMRKEAVSSKAVIRQLYALSASRFEPEEYDIRAATLVISGEFDSLIPHCYAQHMADLIEDSSFVMLRKSGHNPINECPKELEALLVAFLQTGTVDVRGGNSQPAA